MYCLKKETEFSSKQTILSAIKNDGLNLVIVLIKRFNLELE